MATSVEPGSLVAGKYRVERVLGEGGMGIVVEATQPDLERRVAIKLLHANDGDEREQALQRFKREARAAARLRGDHITKVLDVGNIDGDTPYIVMEYLDGRDLRSTLDHRGPLPLSEAVSYLLQACEAMAEAHASGIVHRDLKPANLFLAKRPDGRPLLKVLDFGISKLMSESHASLTKTRGGMGSPLYLSPEQFESAKNVDHRTDIWSLGAVLYELLTGLAAFAADSIPAVYGRVMSDRRPTMKPFRDDVPDGLDAVVQRCLSKNPNERYPTVADLALALQPFAPASAHGYVASAVRIVQASTLAHPGLPESAPESLVDPGAPTDRNGPPRLSSTELSSRDTELAVAERAFDSSPAGSTARSGPGGATEPAWTANNLIAGQRSRRRRSILIGAGVAVAALTTLAFLATRPEDVAEVSTQPETAASTGKLLERPDLPASAAAAPSAPASAASPALSASAAAEPQAGASSEPNAPAKVVPRSQPKARPTKKTADPAGGDDMLMYRR